MRDRLVRQLADNSNPGESMSSQAVRLLIVVVIFLICGSAIADSGKSGTLQSKGSPNVLVGTSQKNFDRMIKLLAAKDIKGLGEMVAAGQVLQVPSGTKCLIIDLGVFIDEVRLSGGKYSGTAVFVESEYVKRK